MISPQEYKLMATCLCLNLLGPSLNATNITANPTPTTQTPPTSAATTTDTRIVGTGANTPPPPSRTLQNLITVLNTDLSTFMTISSWVQEAQVDPWWQTVCKSFENVTLSTNVLQPTQLSLSRAEIGYFRVQSVEAFNQSVAIDPQLSRTDLAPRPDLAPPSVAILPGVGRVPPPPPPAAAGALLGAVDAGDGVTTTTRNDTFSTTSSAASPSGVDMLAVKVAVPVVLGSVLLAVLGVFAYYKWRARHAGKAAAAAGVAASDAKYESPASSTARRSPTDRGGGGGAGGIAGWMSYANPLSDMAVAEATRGAGASPGADVQIRILDGAKSTAVGDIGSSSRYLSDEGAAGANSKWLGVGCMTALFGGAFARAGNRDSGATKDTVWTVYTNTNVETGADGLDDIETDSGHVGTKAGAQMATLAKTTPTNQLPHPPEVSNASYSFSCQACSCNQVQ